MEDKYLDLWDKIQQIREEFEAILTEEGTITRLNYDAMLEQMQEYLQHIHRKHEQAKEGA